MSIDEAIKDYEDTFWYMVYNQYSKETVRQHYYSYHRHLDQYYILKQTPPSNDFETIKQMFLKYMKKP